MKIILSLLTILILSGCTNYEKEFKQALGTSLTYTAYKKEPVQLSKEMFQEVKNWFLENTDNWSSSYVSFVPHNELSNKTITINIHKNQLIVNMKKKNGDWIQATKPVDSETITFIKKLKN